MPINAHPEYLAAEREYLLAQTLEDKIEKLKKMISHSPSHKGAENLRAQLKTRLKKLTQQKEKSKKTNSGKTGIKKSDMQAVIVGEANSGKSSLLKNLTNTYPKIADYSFTTKTPQQGMMNFATTQIQIIENPAIESEYYDKGLTNNADTLIILIYNLKQLEKINKEIEKVQSKKIICVSKSDKLNSNEKRKISATLQSKKYNFVLISNKNLEGIEELKYKIFESFGKIRIFTKEPGKNPEKSKPVILEPGETVKNVAEKILHGFSKQIKQIKIWGPSSKFPGQIVGLKHKLKDLDIVEFKTN